MNVIKARQYINKFIVFLFIISSSLFLYDVLSLNEVGVFIFLGCVIASLYYFLIRKSDPFNNLNPVAQSLIYFLMLAIFLGKIMPDDTWIKSMMLGSDTYTTQWPFTIQAIMWFLFVVFVSYFLKFDHSIFSNKEISKNNLELKFKAKTETMEYITWVIPTLGFLGTVIGMSLSLGVIIKHDDILVALEQGMMSEVVASLSLAFNTTILGIMMNVVCMFMMSKLNKRLMSASV